MSINEVHDSSITYSNRGYQIDQSTLDLFNGNNTFFQNNITRNYCQANSAFGIGDGQGTSSIKYSIIDENYAQATICWADNKPIVYNSIVFINNTVSDLNSNYIGMFYCHSCSATFENCYIANNKQNGLYLFGIWEPGSVTVSKSYIDATNPINEPDKQVKITESKNVSLEFHLHSTELCPIGNYFVYIDDLNQMKTTNLRHGKVLRGSNISLISKS